MSIQLHEMSAFFFIVQLTFKHPTVNSGLGLMFQNYFHKNLTFGQENDKRATNVDLFPNIKIYFRLFVKLQT